MKIDLHTHTSYGSACAYMDPDELVRRARLIGLDGVCITEHDHVWDTGAIERLRDRHDFLVIGGVEVSTDCGHVLVFGLHRPVRDIYYFDDLKTAAAEAGAVMVMAHPFRYEPEIVAAFTRASNGRSLIDSLCEREIFHCLNAMEICNGRAGFGETELASRVANRLRLNEAGGSDAHASLEVGACYSVFDGEISNEQDLIAEIRRGAYRGVDPRWRDRIEFARL